MRAAGGSKDLVGLWIGVNPARTVDNLGIGEMKAVLLRMSSAIALGRRERKEGLDREESMLGKLWRGLEYVTAMVVDMVREGQYGRRKQGSERSKGDGQFQWLTTGEV